MFLKYNNKKVRSFYNESNFFCYMFSICQSIGALLTEIRNLLILEKGLLPKNPLDADKGLGWVDDKIKCCLLVISFFLLIALLPHNKKTTGSVFSLKIGRASCRERV